MRRLNFSVFAVVSCIVYVITAIESSPNIGNNFELLHFINNSDNTMYFPRLGIILTFILTIIALRLYFHAWAIDVSPVIKKIRNENEGGISLKLLVEWLLRTIWVLMTAYLPSVLSRTYVNLYFFKINWFLYFVIIFLSLYLWDLIMIDSIISISHYVERNRLRKEKAIQDLKEAWFKCDMLLFLLSILICCLFKINLKGDWNNYKIPIFFIIITSMTGISFLQLSMWGSEIIKSSICDQT